MVETGFYNWARTILLPQIYFIQHYNDDLTTDEEMNYTNDLNSWRLGPPMIRQLRVKADVSQKLKLLIQF